MSPKTDYEQLKGILNQFEYDVIYRVIEDFNGNGSRVPYKHRSDFSSPGSEVAVGADGNVSLESLGYIERIINESNLLPVAFLEEGALRQKAVARLPIYNPGNPLGDPHGTGFLVSNSLIMTNNHVIGSAAEAKNILVQFNYQVDIQGVAQAVDTWRLDPDAFFYTNAALDFTLVRVKGKPFIIKPPVASAIAAPDMSEMMVSSERLASVLPVESGSIMPILRYPGWQWGFIQLQKTVNYAAGQLLNW